MLALFAFSILLTGVLSAFLIQMFLILWACPVFLFLGTDFICVFLIKILLSMLSLLYNKYLVTVIEFNFFKGLYLVQPSKDTNR